MATQGNGSDIRVVSEVTLEQCVACVEELIGAFDHDSANPEADETGRQYSADVAFVLQSVLERLKRTSE